MKPKGRPPCPGPREPDWRDDCKACGWPLAVAGHEGRHEDGTYRLLWRHAPKMSIYPRTPFA